MKPAEPIIKETVRDYSVTQDKLLDAIVAECTRAKFFEISNINWNRVCIHIEFNEPEEVDGIYKTEIDYKLHEFHYNLIKEKLKKLKNVTQHSCCAIKPIVIPAEAGIQTEYKKGK